jgi:hypothetical protein
VILDTEETHEGDERAQRPGGGEFSAYDSRG